jgi:hypothetical protein
MLSSRAFRPLAMMPMQSTILVEILILKNELTSGSIADNWA